MSAGQPGAGCSTTESAGTGVRLFPAVEDVSFATEGTPARPTSRPRTGFGGAVSLDGVAALWHDSLDDGDVGAELDDHDADDDDADDDADDADGDVGHDGADQVDAPDVDPGHGGASKDQAVLGSGPGHPSEVRAVMVATFSSERLLTGLVTALAQACREGIDVRYLTQMSAVPGHAGRVFVNVGRDRGQLLQSKVDDAMRRMEKAAAVMVRTEDETKSAHFEAQYDAARADIAAYQSELDSLHKPAQTQVRGPVHTYSDLLSAAFDALISGGDRITQRQRQALGLVMPEFAICRDARQQWQATATIRLATVDGGVAELGPVSWSIGAGGRGSGVRGQTKSTGVEASVVESQLAATGAVNDRALKVLRNATFRELSHVVLHGLTGHDLPEWVGPQWREPTFVAWITQVYSDPGLTWKNGAYALFSPLRQFVAHACSQHDMVTMDQFATMIPFDRNSVIARLAHTQSHCRVDYHPPIRRTRRLRTVTVDGRQRSRSTHGFESVRCPCGKAAHIVVRIPEVPRSLLCECGRMPEAADFGMPADVRFPDEYMNILCLSQEACEAEIRSEYAQKRFVVNQAASMVLEQLQGEPDGLTVAQIHTLTPLDTPRIHDELRALVRRGLVRARDPELGTVRTAWVLETDPTS